MDYVTNYATKDPTAKDFYVSEKMAWATLLFVPSLGDREISGVQVASTLLQLSSHYTVKYNICLALLTRVEGVKKVTRWCYEGGSSSNSGSRTTHSLTAERAKHPSGWYLKLQEHTQSQTP